MSSDKNIFKIEFLKNVWIILTNSKAFIEDCIYEHATDIDLNNQFKI